MASKIHTRFQTWALRNYVNITLIRTPPPPPKKKKQKQKQKKISENPFRIRTFLFLSYSFGIETINTFRHSCSSLDNHTRFQDEKEQKSYPLGGGAHTYSYVAYAREYPWGFSLAWATQQGQVAKRCQNANESLLCCFRKDRLDSDSNELTMLPLGYAGLKSWGLTATLIKAYKRLRLILHHR